MKQPTIFSAIVCLGIAIVAFAGFFYLTDGRQWMVFGGAVIAIGFILRADGAI